MPKRLSVPFYRQNKPGYCLAACAQMALAYWESIHDQEELARRLGVQPHLGAPIRNIHRLASSALHITVESGDLNKLQQWLSDDVPVIAFIQAGELPHWQGEFFQHAVVIVEISQDSVWMLDPDAGGEPLASPIGDFMLAWSELDYLYAVIIAVS